MTKYNIMLIYENGEGYKIVGIRDGKDPYDFISKKHDSILDEHRGSIEIKGNPDLLTDYIVLEEEYYLNFDEKEKYNID